jgi:hypothetical protein
MLWNLSSKKSQWIGVQQLSLNVWNYTVESIDYWTIFSLMFLKNQDQKLFWNLGAFLVLFENPHQILFNKVDFVILKLKMWTILLNFWWVCIVVGNSNKLQKGGLEGPMT